MAEYEEQKKQKPSIDLLTEQLLKDELKEEALDFIAFLRENKLSPQWGAKNSFNTSYKTRRVCIVKINEDSLDIRVNTQYDGDFNACFGGDSERIKDYLLGQATFCMACGTCKPGIDMELLGREYKNLCFNPVIRFENPDRELLELAKRLVLERKKAIAEGRAPKVTYIGMKKR